MSDASADVNAISLSQDDLAAVQTLTDSYRNIKREMAKVIVGQSAVLDELLIALFCRGHALLLGVPGLAKTLMINTLARTMNLSFSACSSPPT